MRDSGMVALMVSMARDGVTGISSRSAPATTVLV